MGKVRRARWLAFVWLGACAVAGVVLAVATAFESFLVLYAAPAPTEGGTDSEGLTWLHGLVVLVVLWAGAVLLVFRPAARWFWSRSHDVDLDSP